MVSNNKVSTNVASSIVISAKAKKILKGSLDPIPSPSVKIQITGGKFCLRCKGKTLLGIVNKLLRTECFVLLPQTNFPTNILYYHSR